MARNGRNIVGYCVYIHIFPNGKKYIGTNNIYENESPIAACHRRWGKEGINYKKQVVGKAIGFYGWNNIEHKILYEYIPENEIDELEIQLIKEYNTHISNNKGYNVSFGGKHCIVSEETRQKLSDIMSGENHPNYGKTLSLSTRNKIKMTNMGHSCSDEAKEKMRKAWEIRKKNGYIHPFLNKKFSDEHKEKISKKAKERLKDKENHPNYKKKMSEEQRYKISITNMKPIIVFNIFGEFEGEYQSSKHYSNILNNVVGCTAIANCANGYSLVCQNKLIFYKDYFSEDMLSERLLALKDTHKYKKYYYYRNVIECFKSGLSVTEISKKLNCTKNIVKSCLLDEGITLNKTLYN